MLKFAGTDRRAFLAAVSSIGVTAFAGCSSESGGDDGGTGSNSDDGGDGSPGDALTIEDNEIGSSGTVTTSTLTIKNAAEEEVESTISVEVGIGPDGLYGQESDQQSTSIAGGETTGVTLDLFDGSKLSEVALEEINNGYFTISVFADSVEKSTQEFGEESSQYVSFRVLYTGGWQGSLGTESGQSSISGQGDSHLPVDNSASIVSGNAQKQDGGSGTLTVEIIVDDEVISEQSTSTEYGVAQISENI